MTGRNVSSLIERSVGDASLPRFEISEWREEYGVVAGITGADGGFDLGLCGLSKGNRTNDDWKTFQECFTQHFRQIVVSRQQHGKRVGRWGGERDGISVVEDLDGHLTTERGVLLAVLVADCVPVYLLDPFSRSIALLHAGWRGIATGILEAGISLLESTVKSSCRNLVMHCGISVCGQCYEVGPDVVSAITGEDSEGPRTFDLRAALAERAHRLGIETVTSSPLCTVHDSGQFHSYRAMGDKAGRMAAYIGIPLS